MVLHVARLFPILGYTEGKCARQGTIGKEGGDAFLSWLGSERGEGVDKEGKLGGEEDKGREGGWWDRVSKL